MNIDEFEQKVLTIVEEAKSITEKMDNEQKKYLGDFCTSINILVDFVKDNLNITVLKKHKMKENGDASECPLDEICKNVWDRLEEIDLLLKKDIFDFLRMHNNNTSLHIYNSQNFYSLINILRDESFLNLLSVYKVLKHLDGHSKTLVILGPNGSGKTSFANYLKNLDTHVKVIPASKPIKAVGHIPRIYNASLDNFNSELYSGGVLNEDLLQKLIIGMCSEHDDIARQFMETGKRGKKSTYEKVKEIFDGFFEVNLDSSAFSTKSMKAKKDGGRPFDFNNMSDGERVAFFYISTVIAAPRHSFIIVDEPENHLNPAIYNKIWEKLINHRNDCQFIFISHTIEFVSARTNFELVKIKNFEYPDKFEFDFLGNTLENINSDVLVEILGSRKPILFCEGSKVDYDYRVYEILFGEKYTIVPTGNCISVERSVEACNMHALAYSIQSAIGIIDSDLKSDEEIGRLKEKKIYTLKCNEIEMLLIDEEIFKKSLRRVFKPESLFYDFSQQFFCKLEERKNNIIKRMVKTQIDKMLHKSIIDDKNNKTKDDIKANFSNIIGKVDIDQLWQDSETIITKIIAQKDYEAALKFCCLEHGEIISGIGNRIIPDYGAIALGVLREDCQLAKTIRKKYFCDIDM